MSAYTVHAPRDFDPDDPDTAERLRFVKDGFSWPALFFAPLWILWHRMWLTLVWYVVFVLVVMWTDRLLGEASAQVLGLLGALWLGFEGNDIIRRSLRAKGWTEFGGSFGRGRTEAEIRYFASWGRPTAQSAESLADKREALARAAWPASTRPHEENQVLGLFPEPEM